MSAKSTQRLVREGEFVAEVDVALVEAEGGWTPYLSFEDAYKLDAVRDALREATSSGPLDSPTVCTVSRRSKPEKTKPANTEWSRRAVGSSSRGAHS